MPAKKSPQKNKKPIEDSSVRSSSDDEKDISDFPSSKYFNKNYHREFMARIPTKIRDRTKLLLSLDDKYMEKHADYEKMNTSIKMRYELLYQPLWARRREIVTGDGYGVTEEEVMLGYPEDHAGKVELVNDDDNNKENNEKKEPSKKKKKSNEDEKVKELLAMSQNDNTDDIEEKKGIPDFWLTALKHNMFLSEVITEKDEEILKLLLDVTAATLENGFTVLLTFPEDNGYFTGTQLTKTVYTKTEAGSLAIDHTDQTEVQWISDDRNPTIKKINKKIGGKGGKGKAHTKTITKTEPCESFFNMFKETECDEREQWAAVAMKIYERTCPFAVEHYTGEASCGESDFEDGDEEDDDEDDDDDDDMPTPMKSSKGRGHSSTSGEGGKECKQQ